ncbi:formyltetrahydrofolate deformylase [Pinibacter aurantiacus]|uniref:Formyltetrahydrofolate deformylase n=1 Tax=Pinibacter aurantiacus TaxID=2851599 RepID=A0A9E2W1R8_9BACT|nr:formyltetrahydrofolate deformylase [Pinibacter aurantiacus]MBV4356430.1 formyltetrahydrofolate deformylase [Pinibacter aurantiacus]
MKDCHILLIKCADRQGLIANITGVLFRHSINVVVMKEFVEPETNTYFSRLELLGPLDVELIKTELLNTLPADTKLMIHPRRKKDIVVLVTKEHHCLGDLLVRHHFDELHANIKAVIGNYDVLKNFTERFDIPFHHIDHELYDKEEFEARVIDAIQQYHPDYIVLAKFMRILSGNFVAKFEEKIINIHHSFLPAFIGANPYRKAYERGVKLIGATAHIVNNDLDEGPIITQKTIPVDHEHDVKGMREAGHEIEKSVLADALKLVFDDRIFVMNNKTIIFN